MSTSVQIGNQVFNYNNTQADQERRKLYFQYTSDEAQLDAYEREILTSLGIDEKLEKSLAPYLADFFKLLPSCSSDPSLLLQTRCEIPYYVLWSVLFANEQATLKRFDVQGPVPTQLNIVKSAAIVSEMKPSDKEQTIAEIADGLFPYNDEKVKQVFTLILSSKTPALTLSDDETIQRVFTLISV